MRAILLFCLGLSLLPAAAVAAPVVVYGPALDADRASAAARAELGTGEFTVVGNLITLAGGSPDAPVVVGGNVSECVGAGSVPIPAVVVQARNAVTEMNYTQALRDLEEASAALPCGASRASRDDLYELYFLQGFAHFNAGDDAAAVADFAVAAALDPQRQWDSRYPPTAKEVFLRGLQQMFDSARADVKIEVEAAFLNGERVGPSSKPTLVAGRHIVRIGNKTLLVTVPDRKDRDEDVVLTTARALVPALLEGNNAYAPWLANLAEQKKWGDQVLVVGGDEPVMLRGRTFEAKQKTASSELDGKIVGGILMGIGAGTAAAGVSLHLVSYDTAGVQSPSGFVLVAEDEYGSLVGQNRAGFATAIAGGALLGVGLVTTIGTLASGKSVAMSTPWVLPLPEGGLALGLGGRF